ncbi:hypothetical protein GCG21_08630 [Pseudactinotalea sp. HY160]|uniref:hypothetical protein n=1 Tax=Pseudactinotalea sp. HY160 TaxID=2654490 RepID=UPI00128D4A1E|nr:hypothetical protein [Pseudactinotalea sp. HY160]MPV50069.1 hypothetical protein [Pseudactinotalea sp. HY160]
MTTITTKVLVLPEGMDAGDMDQSSFAVTVNWRGPYEGRSGGGYSVERTGLQFRRGALGEHPSVPERFRAWQYRWPDLDSALEAAREIVETTVVRGRTWVQWREFRDAG